MKTLQECLADYDTTLLRAIAERRGIELSTHRQPEMVAELADALLDPASVNEALAWLTDEERRALDSLAASEGRMRAHRFAARFGEIRRFGPGSLARGAPWRSPSSPAEGLWYRGMIGRGFAEQEGTVVEFVFVPSDLVPLLPAPQVDRTPFHVSQADPPDRVALGDPALLDDLCTLLANIQARPLRVREGELLPEAVHELLTQCLHKEESCLAFLYHLARAASLLRLDGRTLHLDREPVREWLKRSRVQQLRSLQDTWMREVSWNDLWHVPSIRCEDTGWRNDPVPARKTVLSLLSRCAPGQWLSIPGFVDAVRDQVPDYLRPNGDFESWYIRDARSGEYLTGFEHWDEIEGALLAYLLSGPLHWLGVVSLGYREGWEKPTAFRITPWGMSLVGSPDVSLEELPPQPARVAPEGMVALPRESPLRDRFQLARIAEWRASGAEYIYALTPASLGQALSAGIQLERIERFLQRISGDHVPDVVIGRMRAWGERHGLVRVRRAAVLETRSPQVMNELRTHERIRGYLRQPLSPTLVLVRDSDWPLLIQELYRAGYLPEIIER